MFNDVGGVGYSKADGTWVPGRRIEDGWYLFNELRLRKEPHCKFNVDVHLQFRVDRQDIEAFQAQILALQAELQATKRLTQVGFYGGGGETASPIPRSMRIDMLKFSRTDPDLFKVSANKYNNPNGVFNDVGGVGYSKADGTWVPGRRIEDELNEIRLLLKVQVAAHKQQSEAFPAQIAALQAELQATKQITQVGLYGGGGETASPIPHSMRLDVPGRRIEDGWYLFDELRLSKVPHCKSNVDVHLQFRVDRQDIELDEIRLLRKVGLYGGGGETTSPIPRSMRHDSVQMRFGPCKYEDPQGALSKLLQKGTVTQYQSEFEKLMNHATDVSEGFLISFYVSGLKPATQRELPKTPLAIKWISPVKPQERLSKGLYYFNRKLGPRMRIATTYQKEPFAIVEALYKWRQYLLGHRFTIQTGHRSLKELLQQVIQTPIQQKYLRKLMDFDFIIEYKHGVTNGVADALSRVFEDGEEITGWKSYNKFTESLMLVNGWKGFDKSKIAATAGGYVEEMGGYGDGEAAAEVRVMMVTVDELTIADLEGAGLERLKQQYQNDVELEYHVGQLIAVITNEKYATSITKHYAARYYIQCVEDMIPDNGAKKLIVTSLKPLMVFTIGKVTYLTSSKQ
nr:Ty3/gypsy retrotransposon protein [Tanacetum cinerariifolium]